MDMCDYRLVLGKRTVLELTGHQPIAAHRQSERTNASRMKHLRNLTFIGEGYRSAMKSLAKFVKIRQPDKLPEQISVRATEPKSDVESSASSKDVPKQHCHIFHGFGPRAFTHQCLTTS